ncbi:MAG: helix-turn-helix domain-containing protein [Ferruginibacter sp.]|nr:helix-turn-helix domain-containing protein [Ferruginibacter sp.]
MQNVVLSTRNIDDLINDVANKVVEKIELWNVEPQKAPTQPQDELLTVPQAAQFLSLSVSTVYGLIQKREIPVMKRSKRCYFSKLELINYLKQGRKKTLAETAAEAETYLKKKGGCHE